MSENTNEMNDSVNPNRESLDFVRQIIADDCASGKWGGRVATRFPPEPNGYLHIGHAKSIVLNSSIAQEFNGTFNLRFDDTNPVKEEDEYVQSIMEDIKWLGADWQDRLYFGSDYFQQMYDWAIELIQKGLAYVDDLDAEKIREYRGTLTSPGKPSPFRDRSVQENLDLFERMKNGEFGNGEKVLRAKIDMASKNINMRDPVMYRILHAEHHRSGDKWCIYPMYDWAHGLEDSIEGITHSICTLEFENHRPLYDWFLDQLDGVHHPQQIEFARLNLTYTVMSKRKLLQLVTEKHVNGWDDPRMPTISGMRRRGYSPECIRSFCKKVGVAKFNSTVDVQLLEHCVRAELNKTSSRYMAVLDPVKVVITNYPEGQVEYLDAINNPEDESAGTRKVPFGREIYIEREDFMEDAPKKFFRLSVGREVRLRYAYFITCQDIVKDADGNITEILCTYDPATKGGDAPDGRKVKGTLHWVSVSENVEAEIRMYSHLFNTPTPDEAEEGKTFLDNIDPDSLKIIEKAYLEPELGKLPAGTQVQFERLGYFCVDLDSCDSKKIFNLTINLRDTWAKQQGKE